MEGRDGNGNGNGTRGEMKKRRRVAATIAAAVVMGAASWWVALAVLAGALALLQGEQVRYSGASLYLQCISGEAAPRARAKR